MAAAAQPEIRYAQASNGTNIAYATFGDGLPIVHTPVGVLTPQVRGQHDRPPRPIVDRLQTLRTMVLYDSRGSGYSTRDRYDYSLEGLVEELEVVVDALELDSFDLFGIVDGSATAIAYSARHPERVSRLILYGATPRGRVASPTEAAATKGLAELDWKTFSETYARVVLRFEGKWARHFASIVRESSSLEAFRAFESARAERDVVDLLPAVHASTLVLTREGALSSAEEVTALIPRARLRQLPGSDRFLTDDVFEALIAFLEEGDAVETLSRRVDQRTVERGSGPARSADEAPPDGLTRREVEVLQAVAAGRSNAEIGDQLSISPRTVARHVSNALDKTGLSNRTELATYALLHGLVAP